MTTEKYLSAIAWVRARKSIQETASCSA